MSVEQNKQQVRYLVDEINKGNVGVIDEVVSEDYVDHNPMLGMPGNREGFKQLQAMIRQGQPDAVNNIEDIFGEGDKVVWRWRGVGTHHGVLFGAPPTGKVITITGIEIYRFTDGKIVEHWSQIDALGMMQQLGFMPEPASQPAGLR